MQVSSLSVFSSTDERSRKLWNIDHVRWLNWHCRRHYCCLKNRWTIFSNSVDRAKSKILISTLFMSMNTIFNSKEEVWICCQDVLDSERNIIRIPEKKTTRRNKINAAVPIFLRFTLSSFESFRLLPADDASKTKERVQWDEPEHRTLPTTPNNPILKITHSATSKSWKLFPWRRRLEIVFCCYCWWWRWWWEGRKRW